MAWHFHYSISVIMRPSFCAYIKVLHYMYVVVMDVESGIDLWLISPSPSPSPGHYCVYIRTYIMHVFYYHGQLHKVSCMQAGLCACRAHVVYISYHTATSALLLRERSPSDMTTASTRGDRCFRVRYSARYLLPCLLTRQVT